jgi:predicted transcriptional regulator of viral defense system
MHKADSDDKTMTARARRLARRSGVFRMRDAVAAGVHPEVVRRLWKSGELRRTGRGLYELDGYDVTEHHSLVEAAGLVPRGVVCLLSALMLHDLTTQFPHGVWMAIGQKARTPKPNGVVLHVVRFSGPALTEGVESHAIEGTAVRVFSVAKTVADSFKFRNKIGLDVALEALHEGWRARRFAMDELRRCAKVCRVANVIRPYVEGMF